MKYSIINNNPPCKDCFKPADRILVLGGTGHLGSAFIHYIIKNLNVKPEQIRVFYLENSPTGSLADINGLEFFPGNILDYNGVFEAFKGITYAFHVIGNTTFDPRLKRIQWLVNVEGTRNVLNSAIKSDTLKRLCYTSTVNTLGVPNPIGIIGDFHNSNPYTNKPKLHSFKNQDETLKFANLVNQNEFSDELRPIEYKTSIKWWKRIGIGYFDSKLAAQELVNSYHQKYGLNVVSILPGTMFGPYDYLISAGMYIISLYNNQMPGVLSGGMPFMHVFDSIEGHLLAVEKGKSGERYIITGLERDCLYMKEMVKIIVDVLKKRFPNRSFKTPKKVFRKRIAYIGGLFSEIVSAFNHKPNPLSRDAVIAGSLPTFYSFSKAEAKLGYFPKRPFELAVEEMLDYLIEKDLLAKNERFADKIT